jgi:hypothetical protein
MISCSTLPVATTYPLQGVLPYTPTLEEPLCILIPADASFAGEAYPGSGREVAERIEQVIEEIGRKSRLVDPSRENAQTLCEEKGARFALQPVIVQIPVKSATCSG